ncbi:MAG: Bug family tripartite tricarboxylate transporter substrate binding protein [Candidatus Rokuibacteriota bacterium]
MRRIIVPLAILTVALFAVSAGFAAYPERPIKMIVPWAAGGDTDVIKRVWADMAKKHLDQPIIVANITGASGTKGAREAKGSPADGYTIYSVHESIHTTYHTGVSDVSYRDFEPVCLIASTPSIVAASGASPWKTFKDLMEDSRKRPGDIKVGATLGSTSHFFPAMVERGAKIKWKYVSYEGTAPRMTALLGGHIDLGESNLTQLDKVKAGQMKLLAIATEKRHPAVPDLPTLTELGVDVTYAVSRGILAPKGTPEPALARLEQVCAKVTSDPAFAAEMKKHGTDVKYLDRKAYATFLEKSDAQNAELAGDLGYKRK